MHLVASRGAAESGTVSITSYWKNTRSYRYHFLVFTYLRYILWCAAFGALILCLHFSTDWTKHARAITIVKYRIFKKDNPSQIQNLSSMAQKGIDARTKQQQEVGRICYCVPICLCGEADLCLTVRIFSTCRCSCV